MLCPLPFQPWRHGSGCYSWGRTVPFQCSSLPILSGDPEAVLGGLLWGPWGSPAIPSTFRRPSHCSNFGADSLESIRGRRLLCRHQQPVAEPQQSNRNPLKRCTKGSATRTQQKAANQRPQHHRLPDPWSVQSSSWIPFFREQGMHQFEQLPNPWFTLCLFPEEL